MVYRDISSEVDLPLSRSGRFTQAQLLDRFFSFLIDYFVISPFVLFALYLFFKNEYEFIRLQPTVPEALYFQILIGVSFVALFALVQTCFVGLWRATPGQYYLKLKFQSDDSLPILQYKVFLRQILFWLSFPLLGLPFLSMLTNARRRTFYDQIADVSVVTFKQDAVSFTFESEYKYWRALQMTLSLFLAAIVTAAFFGQYQFIEKRMASYRQYQQNGLFCSELDGFGPDERLQAAVALHLVDQISDECLNREAHFVLWKQKRGEMSLAYWAKSLTAADEAREAQYAAQACVSTSDEQKKNQELGCMLATAFENNQFENLLQQLDLNRFFGSVVYHELSVILEKNDSDVPQLFYRLEPYQDIKLVKKYMISTLVNVNETQPEAENSTDTQRSLASVEPLYITETQQEVARELPSIQDERAWRIEKINELLSGL